MQQNDRNRRANVCKIVHAIRKRFLADLGSIFECFFGDFEGILASKNRARKKEGLASGLGGHREGQQGGFWWISTGKAQEDPARRLHPEGWAGGLFALRVTRRGHSELGGLEAQRLRGSDGWRA